jgi:hypothetical protein
MIVLGIVILAVGGAIFSLIHGHRSGKCSCGCKGCSCGCGECIEIKDGKE